MNKGTKNFSFPKREHLTGKINIERLLKEGKSYKIYPFRIIYLFLERKSTEPKVRVLISVPKTKFHKATQRNKIKRRIREAFRLNKNSFWDLVPESKKLDLGIIYIAKETCNFSLICDKIKDLHKEVRNTIFQ